jgi:tripartite-type tricarboxylate transporter receptor subunit TctC
MKFARRRFLHLAAGAATHPALPSTAWAQTYPTRTVRIIVGFAAGGGNDIVARLIGQWLSERLGQPVLVENRIGGGGNIATEAVVTSPPDGYTLLQVSSTNARNTTLYEKLKEPHDRFESTWRDYRQRRDVLLTFGEFAERGRPSSPEYIRIPVDNP